MKRVLSAMREHKSWMTAIGLVVLAVLVGSLVYANREQDDERDEEVPERTLEEGVVILDPEARQLAGILAAEAGPREIRASLTVPGVIHPNADNMASIRTMSLGTVERVFVNVGSVVQAGQVLAVLRSPTLAEAESSAVTAEAELKLAQETLARTKELAKLGSFSRPDYESAARDFRAAEQEYLRTKQELDAARKLAGANAFAGPAYEAARERYERVVEERKLAESTLGRVRTLAEVGQFRDPALEEAQRDEAAAFSELTSAQKELDVARAELQRLETSLAAGTIVHEPVETAQKAFDDAGERYGRARAEATRAQKEFDRVTRLGEPGLASQREIEAATAAKEAALAALSSAEDTLTITKTQLDRARRLREENVPAGSALDAARQRGRNAEARLREAETRSETAGQRLSRQRTIAQQNIVSQQEIATAEEALAKARATEDAARAEWERQQQIVAQDLPTQRALTQAETAYRSAETAYQVTRNRYDREKSIFEGNFRAAQQLAEAETAAKRAEVRAQSARAAVRILASGRNLGQGRFTVVSPIAGHVISRAAKVGDVVSEADVLFEVANIETVWIEAMVFDRDIPVVRTGQSIGVAVDPYPDRTFTGRISSIDVVLSEETRRTKVRSLVENPEGLLRPGMFATVTITVGERTVPVAVLLSAVQSDEKGSFVYMETQPNRFERRDVALGSRDTRFVEILRGVKPGEKAVVEGAFLLKSEAAREAIEAEEH